MNSDLDFSPTGTGRMIAFGLICAAFGVAAGLIIAFVAGA
jgi:hypothetical protein